MQKKSLAAVCFTLLLIIGCTDNKSTVTQIYDAMNSKQLAKLDNLVASDFVDHDPATGQSAGLAGLKQSLTIFETEFPDLHFTIEEAVAEGDLVSIHYLMTGTNTGASREMIATNRRVDVNGFDLLRFKNGKAIEHWGLADNMKMMQQVGMIGDSSKSAP